MLRSRDWIAVQLAIALVTLSVIGAIWVLAAGSGTDGVPSAPASAATAGQPVRLATNAGDMLVLAAAWPGGEVRVTAIPGDESTLSASDVTATAGSTALTLQPGCGWNCFRTSFPVLAGEETPLTIVIRNQSRATLRIPPSAPPAGADLFRAVNRRMRAVKTVQVRETLSNGRTTLRTSFAFRAPDRMSYRTSSGARAVVVGPRRWDWLEGRWQLSPTEPIRAPAYIWTGAGEPQLLGRTVVGGRPVQVLSLYRQDDDRYPAWFRLLVAADNRVLTADMLAPAHFMVDRFSDFDEPVTIEPPG